LGERVSVASLEQTRKKLQGLEIFNNGLADRLCPGARADYRSTFPATKFDTSRS
jgi:hypothetical protein